MSILVKNCDICNTKINKLDHWFFGIFTLKEGRIIQCSKCKTEYKTLKTIQFLGKIYDIFYLWMLAIFGLTLFIWSFNNNFGGEVWLYSIAIYIMIEFMIMVLVPLKKINDENKDIKNVRNK